VVDNPLSRRPGLRYPKLRPREISRLIPSGSILSMIMRRLRNLLIIPSGLRPRGLSEILWLALSSINYYITFVQSASSCPNRPKSTVGCPLPSDGPARYGHGTEASVARLRRCACTIPSAGSARGTKLFRTLLVLHFRFHFFQAQSQSHSLSVSLGC
jgi:hypothetical protein